jgi:uncharacterized membrane protein YhdT
MQDADRQTLVVLVPAIALAAWIVLAVVALTQNGVGERAVWFTAMGATIMFIGVMIAIVALYISDVLEKPHPHVWIELKNEHGDGYVRLEHGERAVEQLTTIDDRRYRERNELTALVSQRFAVMAVIASCSMSRASEAAHRRVG